MPHRSAAVALATVLAAAATAPAQLVTILEEDFATDPVAAGRAAVAGESGGDASRFDWSAGALTAAYDTLLPTSKLVWQLPGGATVTPQQRFAFETTFTLHSAGFTADPEGFAQIAFGLQNSATTGNQRTGYAEFNPIDFSVTPIVAADAFDLATFDYFPNISPWFPGPSLQPVVVGSDDGNLATDIFVSTYFPTTVDSAINNSPVDPVSLDIGDLPRDAQLTARFDYHPATRRVTLRVLDDQGNPLNLNTTGDTGTGGLDGDTTTIDYVLPPGAAFEADSFAILLWQDLYAVNKAGGPVASVTADVTFEHFRVQVPEPASAAALAAAALLLPRRRRHRH